VLTFNKDEIIMLQEGKDTCVACERRRASWEAAVRGIETEPNEDGIYLAATGMMPMCGWCIMYSGKSTWGYENRDEILNVGRAAQEQALKVRRDPPQLDERGRLDPEGAERFMLGVAFTVKMMSKMGMPLKYLRGPL
jgi:hypothetical protein